METTSRQTLVSPPGSNIHASRHQHELFSYAALDSHQSQIRLLTLHPSASQLEHSVSDESHFARPICCSVLTVSLDEPPPYKALSYCWGDDDRSRHSVNIEGAALRITESLDSALRHLRHPTEPVIVWIDQLCINQDDNSEKNVQVAMMARIYSKAEQVLVWLGPADQGSDEAMDFYAQVGCAITSAGLDNYCTRDLMPLLDAAVHTKDPHDQLWQHTSSVQTLARRLLLPRLQAVADWDRRDWFGRVWVVQEFCVGADPLFVCGRQQIPADYVKTTRLFLGLGLTHEFLRAVRDVGGDAGIALVRAISNDDPLPAFFGARSRKQRYDRGEIHGSTLFELLRKIFVGRHARASLPVDRVFSLVGLAADADDLGVCIDYNRTAVHVLTDVAEQLIRRGTLAVLSYVQFPRDVSDLPSWVPDWRPNLRPSFYPYPLAGLEHEHYFAPSGNLPSVFLPGLNEAVLGLGGYAVDVVEDLGSIWTDDNSGAVDPLRHQSHLAQIRFLCRLSALKNNPIYKSRKRRDEAEWRIPIADIWEANEPGASALQRATSRAMTAFAEFRNDLAWLESGGLTGSVVAPATGDSPSEASMYRLSMAKMSGMRPFITNFGYVGVGPPAMCPGDVVVVFFGARVCSVLRPRRTSASLAKQYLHVGEAYCDGVMDGELLSQRLEEQFYLI